MEAFNYSWSKHFKDNEAIAADLDEIAKLLAAQSENPFRIKAYKKAAHFARHFRGSLADFIEARGVDDLAKFPHIGRNLAKAIATLAKGEKLGYLQKLRGDADPETLLTMIPTIGPGLASVLHDEYHVESIYDLEKALQKGKLSYFRGIGPKRERAIRDFFETRQNKPKSDPQNPSIAELLQLDEKFRSLVRERELPKSISRTYNIPLEPPVWHLESGSGRFTLKFSRSEKALQMGRSNDWVVATREHSPANEHWTIITSQYGPLVGKRIVCGREYECETFYKSRAS